LIEEVTKLIPDESIEILVETNKGFERQTLDITDCVLVQYTGLKDKHGKDIYEGDLIDDGTPYRAIVEPHILNPGRIVARYLEYPAVNNYQFDDLVSDANREWEIVGNVYEHHNLLGDEK
jgi:hypothetical protein